MIELFSKIRGRVRSEVPLAPYVAYRIGGPAEVFIEPSDEEDIKTTLEICDRYSLPVFSLGNGTNLLIRDGGIRGVILFLGSQTKPPPPKILHESETDVWIRVPSNMGKAHLLDWALLKGLGGLEFSAGIPGTLGGAVYMNAGTKWGSYGEVISRVRLFSLTQGFVEKTRDEMGFKYRGHGEGVLSSSTVVVSVDLILKKAPHAQDPMVLVDEILKYRGFRQPLEMPNCGSVFKNPANSVKGAGRLIEACGLKGRVMGRAQISTKHANFIVNLGGAKAKDVEGLIALAQREGLEKTESRLDPEVIFLGQA